MMNRSHSPLVLVLSALLERGFGVESTDELLDRLEVVARDHGLEGDKVPAWMLEFFDRVLKCRMTPMSERYKIPDGYPMGGSGLCNVLLDIDEDVCPLGVDEQGEAFLWLIPGLKLHVSIHREWRGPGEGVVIKII